MKTKKTFSATKRRHIMACLLALITATVMVSGMTTYLPLQMSEQILLPILLFPIIWVGLFIYAYIAEKAWHPLLVMTILCAVHGALSYLALAQGQG
ncbi:hypothetical protein PESP_b0512 [Pseudoalteromonas espejiana DSM 9414]|uniref:Uncharacterized protein n=1 Tax=Pseudoalteromonas espejiana TaxID=28107 RepID=A0A510Y024_9GAMM|nr:hypothetical protein [Pseudoalteromonas espejiana]ASM52060.1 hypothetical protein PESP_b0512 [Pseudoalteromonas espejiana DSM 9414]GEK56618.1 hypothetical protein PES01_34630 [Pseudoalteromonas espejiana]